MYIYIPYASEASFCEASTLFETKGLKSGPSMAQPKCLPPVAMMAQMFLQELFLGVSGFQYDIYCRNTIEYRHQDLSMDRHCQSQKLCLAIYFILLFRKRKSRYMYVGKKCQKEKHEP